MKGLRRSTETNKQTREIEGGIPRGGKQAKAVTDCERECRELKYAHVRFANNVHETDKNIFRKVREKTLLIECPL